MVVLVLIWQAVVVLFGTPEYILPSPLVILVQAIQDAPQLLDHTLSTLGITLLGFRQAQRRASCSPLSCI